MTRFVVFALAVLSLLTSSDAQQIEWPRVFRPNTYNTRPTYGPAPRQAYQPAPVAPTVSQPAVTAEVPTDPGVADPPTKDVPPVAVWEIQRRGNMVQPVGGDIQSSPIEDVAAALAIPPDDSYKWFITVVTTDNCRYCEKLKADFASSPELQAWVLVADPAKSTCHYQERKWEDSTQKDWFAGVGDQLRRGGFPAIVVQPPRNGQYGPNKTVVTILHGYDGSPKRLSDKMTAAITRYVATLKRSGLIGSADCRCSPSCLCNEGRCQCGEVQAPVIGGVGQAAENDVGGPPPFVVPPKPADVVVPSGPAQDWPAPTPLTLEQIKAAAPGATAEFLLKQLDAKPTDPAVVSLAWQVFQKDQGLVPNVSPAPKDEEETEPVKTPLLTGFWTYLLVMFGGGMLGGLLPTAAIWGLNAFRKFRSASGQKPILNDAQFQELLQFFESLKTPQNPAS